MNLTGFLRQAVAFEEAWWAPSADRRKQLKPYRKMAVELARVSPISAFQISEWVTSRLRYCDWRREAWPAVDELRAELEARVKVVTTFGVHLDE